MRVNSGTVCASVVMSMNAYARASFVVDVHAHVCLCAHESAWQRASL